MTKVHKAPCIREGFLKGVGGIFLKYLQPEPTHTLPVTLVDNRIIFAHHFNTTHMASVKTF